MKMAARLKNLCLTIILYIQLVKVFAAPNVLFLVVDDLRPKLGCYGESNMVTPNIDQLAAKSVKFQHAYVQQAVCSPSRTSFLTGRRPDSTRIFDLVNYFRHLAGNYTTLPQHFKNNGYITQSVGKIFHPGSASGGTDDYPYSWSYPAFHAPTEKDRIVKVCRGTDGKLQNNAVCPVDLNDVPMKSLPDIQNTDFTIDFLKNRSMDGKPFFLGMGYHKPHLPFKFPKKFLDLYPMSKISLAPNAYFPPWLPEVAWSSFGELRNYDDIKAMNISTPVGSVPLDYQLKLGQSYSAAASYTDTQVGRVLKALDEFGLSDNTIITFHGDHGWQLGDHGEWCKHTNFDIATRIPMLVHVPGVTSTKDPSGHNFPFHDLFNTVSKQPRSSSCADKSLVSDAYVEAVDLYPTIAELAGLEVPPTCPDAPFKIPFCTEGASMVPIIKNLTGSATLKKWKPAVFSQYPRPSPYWKINSKLEESWYNSETEGKGNPLDGINVMGYTMRTPEYRYTQWLAYNHTTFTADWQTVYARELYIYSFDPLEDLNVAYEPAYDELQNELIAQLRNGWRKALPEL